MIKIKICGLTSREDYDLAISLGAHFTGFIFYPPSPRFISPEKAAHIVRAGKAGNQKKVGVFVDEAPEKIREIFSLVPLDMIQLHGSESPEYCQILGLPFWKAIRMNDPQSLATIAGYGPGTFLLDAFAGQKPGGTGLAWDLELARQVISPHRKIIIAGGVTPERLAEIFNLQPYAVDVCSWVEEYPGKKNPEKMKKLFCEYDRLR